jgi:hypothetical protein
MHLVSSPRVRYTQLNHIQPQFPIATWGGAVAAQAEIPNGPGCGVGGPGQALTVSYYSTGRHVVYTVL